MVPGINCGEVDLKLRVNWVNLTLAVRTGLRIWMVPGLNPRSMTGWRIWFLTVFSKWTQWSAPAAGGGPIQTGVGETAGGGFLPLHLPSWEERERDSGSGWHVKFRTAGLLSVQTSGFTSADHLSWLKTFILLHSVFFLFAAPPGCDRRDLRGEEERSDRDRPAVLTALRVQRCWTTSG